MSINSLISNALFFKSINKGNFDYSTPLKSSIKKLVNKNDEMSPALLEYLIYKITKKKFEQNIINKDLIIISEKYLSSASCKRNITKSNGFLKTLTLIIVQNSETLRWNMVIFIQFGLRLNKNIIDNENIPIVAKIITSNNDFNEDDQIINSIMDKIENTFNFTSPENLKFEVDSINISDQPNTSIFLLNFIEKLLEHSNGGCEEFIMKLYDEGRKNNPNEIKEYLNIYNKKNEIFNDLLNEHQIEVDIYLNNLRNKNNNDNENNLNNNKKNEENLENNNNININEKNIKLEFIDSNNKKNNNENNNYEKDNCLNQKCNLNDLEIKTDENPLKSSSEYKSSLYIDKTLLEKYPGEMDNNEIIDMPVNSLQNKESNAINDNININELISENVNYFQENDLKKSSFNSIRDIKNKIKEFNRQKEERIKTKKETNAQNCIDIETNNIFINQINNSDNENNVAQFDNDDFYMDDNNNILSGRLKNSYNDGFEIIAEEEKESESESLKNISNNQLSLHNYNISNETNNDFSIEKDCDKNIENNNTNANTHSIEKNDNINSINTISQDKIEVYIPQLDFKNLKNDNEKCNKDKNENLFNSNTNEKFVNNDSKNSRFDTIDNSYEKHVNKNIKFTKNIDTDIKTNLNLEQKINQNTNKGEMDDYKKFFDMSDKKLKKMFILNTSENDEKNVKISLEKNYGRNTFDCTKESKEKLRDLAYIIEREKKINECKIENKNIKETKDNNIHKRKLYYPPKSKEGDNKNYKLQNEVNKDKKECVIY